MRYLYAIVAGLVLALVFGVLERESVLVQDALRKDPPMIHPLACDAIVAQRGAGEPFVSRCYIRGQP